MTTVHAVNQFIQDKVLPQHRPLVDRFRQLIRSEFPELNEEMRGGTEKYYGVPSYRLNRIVVVVSPTKNGITFAFSEGKKFDDRYNMLEGVGNKSRNIRLADATEFDKEKMSYYIRQAVDLDR